MNLKKSDKIIAVAAVIVLIIAAIGIILYVPEEGDGPKNGNGYGYGNEMSFDITATPHDGDEIEETFQLDLTKKLGKLDYKTTGGKKDLFTLDEDNVCDITIEVQYTDNQPSFPILSKVLNILGRGSLGIDELTVTIFDPDSVSHEIRLSGGRKNVTIPVSDMISKDTIEDVSEEAADMQLANLTDENSKWNGQVFQINGQLTVKGKLGLLARLRERFGPESFKVTVSYNYYTYELGDSIEKQTPSTGSNTEGPMKGTSLNGLDIPKI